MTIELSESQEVQVRAAYLKAEDLKLAASLLYQAYHDDPIFLEIFDGNSTDYEQKLRASIREELGAFWQAEQPIVGLYLGEALVGVVCLNKSERNNGSNRFWHWRLKMLLTAGYFSTKQMLEKEALIFDAVPLEHFHMLSFIAIHPLHQKRGLGQYLVAAVNTIMQENPESEGVAVYVTSDKYKQFFLESEYELVKDVSIGNVTGSLMISYRES